MNSDHERLELIRRHVDGTATAEDRQALQEGLRTDAAFRRQFARYANLDAALGSGRLAAAPMAEPVVSPRGQAWMNWFSWRPLTAAAAAAAVCQVSSGGAILVGMERKIIGPTSGSTADTPQTNGVGRARKMDTSYPA